MAQVQQAELKEAIRCMVVDDNPVARMTLRFYIEKHNRLALAGECANGKDAQKALATEPVDLLFLDVEMPDMTGLELLASVNPKPAVIFTTVGRQYAANAFDVEAIDFLLKPIEYLRFCQAIEKAEKHLELSRLQNEPREEIVLLQDGKTMVQVNIHSIVRLEALGDYVKIYGEGRHFTIHATMKALEEKLNPYGFERVHRSHIVKLSAIETLKTKTLVVKGEEIPISETYRDALGDKLTKGASLI